MNLVVPVAKLSLGHAVPARRAPYGAVGAAQLTDPAFIAFVNESELLATAADAEAMYREVILPQRLRMYCNYVASQALTGDLKVLVRTVLAALRN